jgi:hypothetical protein
MRCPRCKHRPVSFKTTLLYLNPFRCGRCGAVLKQTRLLLAGVIPAVLFGGLRLFDGLVTGDFAAAALGVGMGVAAWLAESGASYHLSPYRLCDPGFQPQVPPARLIEHRPE